MYCSAGELPIQPLWPKTRQAKFLANLLRGNIRRRAAGVKAASPVPTHLRPSGRSLPNLKAGVRSRKQ
jgi:hypothetical protein